MKTESRIRFNPGTKEIEIEGSEKFVRAYFNKLQSMISEAPSETAEESKSVKVRPAKKAKKGPKAVKPLAAKKVKRTAKKEPGIKKITNTDAVVTLIQSSTDGISTSELKEKTGLIGEQIGYIINRASKAGKIRKMKRGVYGAA